MLKQLAWVLGLGFVGLLLFGSIGGSILGAIGFVIGSRSATNAASHEAVPAAPTATVAPALDPEPMTRSGRVAWFWAAVGAFVLLVFWLTSGTEDPAVHPIPTTATQEPTGVERVPIVGNSKLWSAEGCLDRHFGAALAAGMVVPPEVKVFCAYPWDTEKLQAVSSRLASMDLTAERVLGEMKPQPAQIELLRQLMAANRRMPMPDGLLEIYDLMKVLPFVWAARSERRAWSTFLGQRFTQDFVRRLKEGSASIDWAQVLTHPDLVRVHKLSNDAIVYLDHGTRLTAEEFVGLAIGIHDNRLEKIERNPMTQTLSSYARSGLHFKHGQKLAIIDMFVGVLDGLADQLRSQSSLQAAWRPARVESRSQTRPFEIYVMRATIEGWCGGVRVNAHGQYCAGEDRVLVVDTKQLSHDGLDNDTPLGMSAPLYHELAHAYLNPVDADEYPFIAEGLATAFGERMLRATAAAVPASTELSPEQSAAFGRLLQTPTRGATEPMGAMLSNTERLEFARRHIQSTAPTQYVKASLCRLNAQPLSVDRVVTYLSRTGATFASQSAEDTRRAYAYSWAIFNYGVDAAAIGQGMEGDQLDASAVQQAARELASNRPLAAELTRQLEKFLNDVNSRASADLRKWRIRCQK